MELGGAESALLGLLQAHDPKRADIDLFLYAHRGELMEFIPVEKVNLMYEMQPYAMIERPISELLRKGFWRLAASRIKAKFLSRHERGRCPSGCDDISVYYYIAESVSSHLPAINPSVTYDLAISFMQPHQFVLDKVRARKKLAWVHTDYSKVYVSPKEEQVWNKYDYVGAISEDVGKSIVQTFPSLSPKVLPIENILSSRFIRQRAMSETVTLQGSGLKFLSIGRYSFQKRFDEIPAIASRLLQTFPDLTWSIIGYGSAVEEGKIRDAIVRENVQEHVFLLGKKTNPYPYIQSCDVYVQPSRYEGKSITVREAQILMKPVIVTAYPTAPSQVIDGVDGVIVPMEIEDCAEAIKNFLENIDLLYKVKQYLSSHDYGNESEIEKIYQLAK